MCIIVYVAMCYNNISVFIVLQNVETQGKGSKATNSVTSILSVCMCVCLCVFICALVCACCVHMFSNFESIHSNFSCIIIICHIPCYRCVYIYNQYTLKMAKQYKL